jgi:dienelactone hydrolase
MKSRGGVRAAASVLLCIVGFALARANTVRQSTVIVGSGDCRMVTDIMDLGKDETQGSVVLLHGLSGNKKIMSYIAEGFAAENLRVFVPDLPGHGRSPGPFSPARAEACTESFVKLLISRGGIDPTRTILAGHSMGGAIAIRVGARDPVAGVIAISSAPMRRTHGVRGEMLLYTDPPPLPPNTLVISGSFEPESMRGSAQDLVKSSEDSTSKFVLIPHATHVSLLFNPGTVRASQEWAAKVLHLPSQGTQPSEHRLTGSLLGFVGLLFLAGPFLRETVGKLPKAASESEAEATVDRTAPDSAGEPPSLMRACLEVAAATALVVVILHFWMPLKAVRLFEGDYFASFLLLAGAGLLAFHAKSIRAMLRTRPGQLLSAAFAGLALQLLIGGWLDLTITESWLTASRWMRFPVFFVAVLPYHAAEEALLGPARNRSGLGRLSLALLLRLIAWGAVMAGILLLHSGEILLALLAPYLALFCILQRRGMDIVRNETGSALATAIFGAILLSGFCLVIFPVI